MSDSSDWEGKLGESSMATQYALGIVLTFIVVGIGLVLSNGILSDPAWQHVTYGLNAYGAILAVWAGILVPVSGIWAAIYESKQNKKAIVPTTQAGKTKHSRNGSPESHRSGEDYETASSGQDASEQEASLGEIDFSYRGEIPQRKRRDYDDSEAA